MMIDFAKFTDPYERKARLYPALLCVLPLVVSVYIAFPVLYQTLSGFVALAVAVGFLQFVSHVARDRGKRLEPRLFESWGGMPSVVLFRFSDAFLPEPAKQRYRKLLEDRTSIAGPSREAEIENPENADAIYRSWSDYLRGVTRDGEKYPMVFKENVNYGFRRNLLGIRWHSLICGFVALGMLGFPVLNGDTLGQERLGVSLLVGVYVLVFFLVVDANWVKITAFAYAQQLLESLNRE